MEKIALWGYGEFGKRIIDFYEKSEQYEIVLVVDGRYNDMQDKLALGKYQISNPMLLFEYCEKGMVDGVVVSAKHPHCEEICKILEERGIKQIFPKRYGTSDISTFAREKIAINDKFFYYCLDDVYVLDDVGISWAYVERDKILKETFHSEKAYGMLDSVWLRLHPSHPLIFEADCVISDETFILRLRHSQNYWHFVFQVLTHILIAEKRGFQGKYFIAEKPYIKELLDLFHIDRERIIFAEEQGKTYLFKHAMLSDIVCADDTEGDERAREGLKLVCEYLAEYFKNDVVKYPERLYVKRLYSRRPQGNFERLAQKYEFEAMIPEEHSVEEQLRYFYHAKVVLCPHGANSTGIIAMRPEACFIETFPINLARPSCLEVVALQNHRYFMVVESFDRSLESDWEEIYADLYRDYEVPEIALESAIVSALDSLKNSW